MRGILVAVACSVVGLILAVPLLIGCNDRVCEPGETQLCHCSDGSVGAQTCNDAGTRWGACECSSTDARTDGDTPEDFSGEDPSAEDVEVDGTDVSDAPDATEMPVEGLVAYYPFNGNADDESGNGYDGLLIGSTAIPDRFGNPSSAFQFDGLDDHILVSDFPHLDTSFTCSVWIFTERSIDQRQTFIGHGGVPDMTWSFSYFYWGVHRYWDIRDRTNGQWQVDFDAVSSWTHFVVIYDVWALLLYVDGAPLDSVWVTTPLEHGATQMLHIGELGWAFEGAIDDIRIYDRALSESEISDLFREARGSRSL